MPSTTEADFQPSSSESDIGPLNMNTKRGQKGAVSRRNIKKPTLPSRKAGRCLCNKIANKKSETNIACSQCNGKCVFGIWLFDFFFFLSWNRRVQDNTTLYPILTPYSILYDFP